MRLNCCLVVMTLLATLDHQPFELDTVDISVGMCLTAMVEVNLDISIETVSSRLVEEWQEGAVEDGTVEDGTKIVKLHILSSMVVMRAMMEQREEQFEQPISWFSKEKHAVDCCQPILLCRESMFSCSCRLYVLYNSGKFL